MAPIPKPCFHIPSHQATSKQLRDIINDMLFPFFFPLSPTIYHNTQSLTPPFWGPQTEHEKTLSNPHTPQAVSPSPHSTGIMCLPTHATSIHATRSTSTNQMPARAVGRSKLLQRNFGGVFLGVVDVLSIVPVAGLDNVLAGDGNSGGPCGAAASSVRYDVEYRRLHL